MPDEVVVDPGELEAFVREVLLRAGMNDEGAATTATALVQTNLWGIDSHGVLRLPAYVRRLQRRAINGRAQPRTVSSDGALELLDGDNGVGFVVGRAAMTDAVELAERLGAGAVGAIRSNHFGAAGLYARIAAERGMVGIAMTNVAPNVVAPGGAAPVTGNNPLAIAVPTGGAFPLVVDVSFSAVAGGKLLLAQARGERIPLDWATDRDGRPTDDPGEGFRGFLLPMGGFKGLGLAYVVDVLCGVVSGGEFATGLKGMYTHPDDPGGIGHFMIALDVGRLIGRDRLHERMASFVQHIHSAPMREPGAEMLLPGELEHRSALRRASGIPLPTDVYTELAALGEEFAVEPPGH